MDPIWGATRIDSIHFSNNGQLMKPSKIYIYIYIYIYILIYILLLKYVVPFVGCLQ